MHDVVKSVTALDAAGIGPWAIWTIEPASTVVRGKVAYATREALHAAKAELTRQGRELVQSADMGELGEFCYFEMPELGSLLELLYVTELPPPHTTVGA